MYNFIKLYKSPVVIVQEYLTLERDFVICHSNEELERGGGRGRKLKFVLFSVT